MYQIALVDDHKMLRSGLARLLTALDYHILFEADNGKDFIDKLSRSGNPDLVLMDITMPVMDGFETTAWLAIHHPEIRVIALTMIDDEQAVIRMMKSGARGYLLKESGINELKTAVEAVMQHGYYYSEMVTGKLIHNLTHSNDLQLSSIDIHLTDKETEFMKLICSELTYKEIADRMHVSPRTVDTYRDHLFEKLELKTRTGLVIYSIKHGIVKI